MKVAIEGTGYRSAAQAFRAGNRQVGQTGQRLTDALAGYAGMAGDDATAADFAAAYDETASAAVDVLEELAGGFASLGRLSDASLRNHAEAEAASVLSGGCPLMEPVADDSDVVVLTPPPSALGADMSSLPGWANVVLDLLEGVFWPDADTDRLRDAAATWGTAATAVGLLAGHCETALGELANELSPEIPLAIATTEDLRSRVDELADQLAALGTACGEQAARVEETREQILDELQQLAVELGIGAVVSGALTVLTGGAAAGAAGGLGAARLASASTKLRGLLGSLGAASRGTAATVRPVSAGLRDTRAYLARLSAARTERGSARVGSGLGRNRISRGLDKYEDLGGHAKGKHVGRTDEQLARRFIEEPNRTLSSTFTDQNVAERAVERVLQLNRSAIDDWIGGGRYKKAFTADVGDAAGRVLVKKSGELIDSSLVRVVLIRRPTSPDGWIIRTAYPDL